MPRTGTREILRNVRVFAVNSETEQETDQDGRADCRQDGLGAGRAEAGRQADAGHRTGHPASGAATSERGRRRDPATTQPLRQPVWLACRRRGQPAPPTDKTNGTQSGRQRRQVRRISWPTCKTRPVCRTAATLPAAQGPAWQMMVLTPTAARISPGTTRNACRSQWRGGASAPPMIERLPPLPPVNGLRALPRAAPAAGSDDDGQVRSQRKRKRKRKRLRMDDD